MKKFLSLLALVSVFGQASATMNCPAGQVYLCGSSSKFSNDYSCRCRVISVLPEEPLLPE